MPHMYSQILYCIFCVITLMLLSLVAFTSLSNSMSLNDLSHPMQRIFDVSILIVVSFKCITSLSQSVYFNLYIRYFNLLFALCTVSYGLLCIMSINESDISMTNALSICFNCIYFIITGILCVQNLFKPSQINYHFHLVSFKLFLLSATTFVLTCFGQLSSYHVWIYLVQSIIFGGNALPTQSLVIYWILSALQYVERNTPREYRTSITHALYFVSMMHLYGEHVQQHCIWYNKKERKRPLACQLSYVNLSLSILLSLESNLMWHRQDHNHSFVCLRCAEYVICFIVILYDFNAIANEVDAEYNLINRAHVPQLRPRIIMPFKQDMISERHGQLIVIGLKLTLLFVIIKICPFVVLSHQYAQQRVILSVQLMIYKIVRLLMEVIKHCKAVCVEISSEQRLHAKCFDI
eukprot:416439_1